MSSIELDNELKILLIYGFVYGFIFITSLLYFFKLENKNRSDIKNDCENKLPELNMQTIMTININSTLQRYTKMIARDLDTIQKLFGANVSRTVKAILIHNLLLFSLINLWVCCISEVILIMR
jgi:hypothetical protein